jgi:hypothetical protein
MRARTDDPLLRFDTTKVVRTSRLRRFHRLVDE